MGAPSDGCVQTPRPRSPACTERTVAPSFLSTSTPSSSRPSTPQTSPTWACTPPSWSRSSRLSSQPNTSPTKPSTTSTHPADSSSVDHRVTPASPAVRSLSTPTAAGVATAVVPSPVRTTPRSTGLASTSPDGWPSPSSRQASADVSSSRSRTPSASPSHCRSPSTLTAPAKSPTRKSSPLSTKTLTSVLARLSVTSTSVSQSSPRPPSTVTSADEKKASHGNTKRPSKCKKAEEPVKYYHRRV